MINTTTSITTLLDFIFKQKKPYVNAMTIIYKLEELQRHLETKKKFGLSSSDLEYDKLIREIIGMHTRPERAQNRTKTQETGQI